MQQAGQGEGAARLGCLHWSQQPQDVRGSMLASWRLATQLASLTDPHIGHFTGATHRPWESTWDYNADYNQAKEEVLEVGCGKLPEAELPWSSRMGDPPASLHGSLCHLLLTQGATQAWDTGDVTGLRGIGVVKF